MGTIHLLNGAAKRFFVSSVLGPAEFRGGSALLNCAAEQTGDGDEAYVFFDTFGACFLDPSIQPEQCTVQSILSGIARRHAISPTFANRYERVAEELVGERRAEKVSGIVFGRS